MAVPVVPVIINTLTTPMPTAKRCFELGRTLGKALERHPKRIALIATGGLSHWPGEAKMGKINVPFDTQFLDRLINGERARLAEYSHSEIDREAGSGGHEIRTWITVAGAVENWQATLLAYEAVQPWATGCGLVAFNR
jgi:aromatic ring-opening dioxygenase catalytic subunit (LigB family)